MIGQICGICERGIVRTLPENQFTRWATKKSGLVHRECFSLIKPSVDASTEAINHWLEEGCRIRRSWEFVSAHTEANEAVKRACCPETVFSYLEKNGEAALTSLFNTVGVDAAKNYKADL